MKLLTIDPGLKNAGYVFAEFFPRKNLLVITETGTAELTLPFVEQLAAEKPDVAVIEKFVVYKGKGVDVEEFARRIGWLEYALWKAGTSVELVKAVDWQTRILAKFSALPKKGQKYNLKAKSFLKEKFGITLPTEHEADAALIATYFVIKQSGVVPDVRLELTD